MVKKVSEPSVQLKVPNHGLGKLIFPLDNRALKLIKDHILCYFCEEPLYRADMWSWSFPWSGDEFWGADCFTTFFHRLWLHFCGAISSQRTSLSLYCLPESNIYQKSLKDFLKNPIVTTFQRFFEVRANLAFKWRFFCKPGEITHTKMTFCSQPHPHSIFSLYGNHFFQEEHLS